MHQCSHNNAQVLNVPCMWMPELLQTIKYMQKSLLSALEKSPNTGCSIARRQPQETARGYLYSVVDNIALPICEGHKLRAHWPSRCRKPPLAVVKLRPEVKKTQAFLPRQKKIYLSEDFLLFVATVHESDWAEKFKRDLSWAWNGGVCGSIKTHNNRVCLWIPATLSSWLLGNCFPILRLCNLLWLKVLSFPKQQQPTFV